jgi:transcriptional regulator with XRE-family HTH domain
MAARLRASFGSRLKELRERRGLSQEELAERSGVPLHSVSRIEQDRKRPKWEEGLALCAALGVSADEFTPEALRRATEHRRVLGELMALAEPMATAELREFISELRTASRAKRR